ncbi:MAG: non-hydrolyzing UDP-N-acetylglucosamine 2-epimerase [Thermoleophilaceae bacterium]
MLAVVGTRPEAIKMFAPIDALRRRADSFDVSVCSSGQHGELLTDALETFGLEVDEDLAAMREGQQPSDLAWSVGAWITDVCRRRRPDVVLVQGDTVTAMAAGLAAFYSSALVAHVEAGLRTYDNSAPWPEEANRRILGAIADIHFAPSVLAAANLLREVVPMDQVHITGNTGIDALHWALTRPRLHRPPGDERRVVITAHRRESIPDGIESIVRAVRTLAHRFPDVRFQYVMHPNPAIREAVTQSMNGDRPRNVEMSAPTDYVSFVHVLMDSFLILTDSGGVQEEAPALGKPVLVTNHRTARQEALTAGSALLVGTSEQRIVEAAASLLDDRALYERMATPRDLYGDGRAGDRVAAALAHLPASHTHGRFMPSAAAPALRAIDFA